MVPRRLARAPHRRCRGCVSIGRRLSTVAAPVLAVIILAGCVSRPSSSPASPVLSPSVAPDATPVPTLSPAGLADVERFRRDFGLRSDEAWILEVAANPASDRQTFGVPLTAQEVEELGRRTRDVEQIKAVVVPYGEAHRAEWAGAFTDHQAGGLFVAQFSGHVAEHRAALLPKLSPLAAFEVREVRWSLRELEAVASRFHMNDPWFRTIPAVVYGVGPNLVANRVDILISSADPRATDLIRDHLGLTDEVLHVTSDGNGALLLPTGRLRIIAVDAGGSPAVGLACVAVPDADGAYEPRPVPMPTTDANGVCELTLPATGYWIHLERGEGRSTLVSLGRAVVLAEEIRELTIIAP